jgi:hypothetical protein
MLNNITMAHFLCWGIPLVFALGQFGNGGFGRHTNEPYDMCAAGDEKHGGHSSQADIYHRVTYYGLLLFCFLAMIAMRLRTLYLKYIVSHPCTLTETFRVASRTLGWYPWLLIICWTPHAVIRSLQHVSNPWHLFGICLKISHGFLLACTYFYQSKPARRLFFTSINPLFWCQLIVKGCNGEDSMEVSNAFLEDILAMGSGSKGHSKQSIQDASTVTIAGDDGVYSPLISPARNDQKMLDVVA